MRTHSVRAGALAALSMLYALHLAKAEKVALPPTNSVEAIARVPFLVGGPDNNPRQFEQNLKDAWLSYQLCHAGAAGSGWAIEKNSKYRGFLKGKGALYSQVAGVTLAHIQDQTRDCEKRIFERSLDPEKVVSGRSEVLSDWKNADTPAKKEAITRKAAERFFKADFKSGYNALDDAQKADYLKGAAKVMANVIEYDAAQLARFKEEAQKQFMNASEAATRLSAIEEFAKSTLALHQHGAALAKESAATVALIADQIADLKVQSDKTTQREMLLMQDRFKSLSGEEQMQWLQSGVYDLGFSEQQAALVQAREKIQKERTKAAAEQLEKIAGGVSNIATLLKGTGLVDDDALSGAVNLFNTASSAVSAYMTGNWIGAAVEVAGLFGGGGSKPDPDAERFKKIMAALQEIKDAIVQVSEQIRILNYQMNQNHEKVMIQLAQANDYLGIIYRLTNQTIADSLVKDAEDLKKYPRSTDLLRTDLIKLNSPTSPVKIIRDLVEPDPDYPLGTPRAIWLSIADFTVRTSRPNPVSLSWKYGALEGLRTTGYALDNTETLHELFLHLQQPFRWKGDVPGSEEAKAALKTDYDAQFRSEDFLNSRAVTRRVSAFADILEFEPFLTFPVLLESGASVSDQAVKNAYSRVIENLGYMQTLVEQAQLQEAVLSGGILSSAILSAGKTGNLGILRYFERGNPQDSPTGGVESLINKLGLSPADVRRDVLRELIYRRLGGTADGSPLYPENGGEVLLEYTTMNAGRALAHAYITTQPDAVNLPAYAKLWKHADLGADQENAMDIIFFGLGRHSLTSPLTIPDSLVGIVSQHRLKFAKEGDAWWLVRRLVVATPEGPLTISRRVAPMPSPESLVRRTASDAPTVDTTPLVSPMWSGLSALRQRIVTLRASYTFAKDFPDDARVLASSQLLTKTSTR